MLQLLIKQLNFTFQRTTTITTTLSTGLYPDDLGQPVLEKKTFIYTHPAIVIIM